MNQSYRYGQRVMVRIERKPDRWVPGIVSWGTTQSITEVRTRTDELEVHLHDLRKLDPSRDLFFKIDAKDRDWMWTEIDSGTVQASA